MRTLTLAWLRLWAIYFGLSTVIAFTLLAVYMVGLASGIIHNPGRVIDLPTTAG